MLQHDEDTGLELPREKRPRKSTALTPNQLAARYGVGVHKVLGWIRRGELRALNVASELSKRPQWRISADALAEFENRRASQATPRAKRRSKPDDTKVIEFY